MTGELVTVLHAGAVSAVDPSDGFAEAVTTRYPGVRVERAAAEQLPYDSRVFDVTLAQLVVHFMADPVRGLAEMLRVTRTPGAVAVCVWDHAGGQGPLGLFWEAARELDPDVGGESHLPGARQRRLGDLLRAAGGTEITESILSVEIEHPSFEEWWSHFCSASAQLARMFRTSIPTTKLGCATSAGERYLQRHSWSRRAPGQREGLPNSQARRP